MLRYGVCFWSSIRKRIDIGPQRDPPRRILLAALHHDAAALRPHPHRQPQLIEQLIQMQAGLQLFAARLRMRMQMPPQRDHPLGQLIHRRIELSFASQQS